MDSSFCWRRKRRCCWYRYRIAERDGRAGVVCLCVGWGYIEEDEANINCQRVRKLPRGKEVKRNGYETEMMPRRRIVEQKVLVTIRCSTC